MSDRRIFSVKFASLHAFLKVAELGNHRDAARALGCNQSTITRFIQDLELWLRGVKLFDKRSPDGLSDEGRAFVPKAIQVLNIMYESRAKEPPRTKISAKDIDMSWYTPLSERNTGGN